MSKTKKNNQYLGKAGHLFVMSEFLARGWNVAIPEVDVGDDILVLEDSSGNLAKIQVKTSNATSRKDGFSAMFQVNFIRLKKVIDVLSYYVFVVRINDSWGQLLLITQSSLLDLVENNMGNRYADNITLYFSYSKDEIVCSNINLSKYINNYQDFPILQH
jgi:hypothetical protein